MGPRWKKLLGDLAHERGRIVLMVTAVTVSLAAVGAVLGAYAILTREVAVNYLGTHPASATLELPDGVDAEVLSIARGDPAITVAEARDVVLARANVGASTRPLLLFVGDDFANLKLNTFRPVKGAWPPPDGTMLLERTALSMLEVEPGETVTLRTPNGRGTLGVSGVVHDPGLAPAWQERMGYAYVSRATLATLGEPPVLHELRIATHAQTRVEIAEAARALGRTLEAKGHAVREVHVPPPRMHPHQLQMTTILVLMLTFSALALILSAVLVANALTAMLARQVREIGVMKTIGARTAQVAGLYAVLVAGLSATGVLLSLPLAMLGAHVFSGQVATMINFELTSVAVPPWVYLCVAVAGLLVPLVVAAVPIARATRITVREAIDRHGVSAGLLRFTRLPPALRTVLRRPARLALTFGLLAAAGAMFMTALDVQRGWSGMMDKFYEARHYDLEVRFAAPQPLALLDEVRKVPHVGAVEAWGYAPAALARPGELDTTSAYPDGRHATFAVFAPPPETALVRFPVLEGRWLQRGDVDAVVLNHAARAQVPNVPLGATVLLSIDGVQSSWRLAGVVEEIGYSPVAYVTDAAFARVTGTEGRARMVRVVAPDRAEALRAVEQLLDQRGAAIEQASPLAEHRTAVGEHISVLIRALVALALVFAVVGALGLGSSLTTSVIERTRELGVMKAVGATSGRLMRALVAEAALIAGSSFIGAGLLSVPLAAAVGGIVGRLGFVAPLPLVLDLKGALAWGVALAVLAPLAALLPARRAARLTVREAISEL